MEMVNTSIYFYAFHVKQIFFEYESFVSSLIMETILLYMSNKKWRDAINYTISGFIHYQQKNNLLIASRENGFIAIGRTAAIIIRSRR